MTHAQKFLVLTMVMAVVAGCGSQRGTHYIPVARDYGQIEPSDVDSAAETVRAAHRVGAQHFAPYDYFSAQHYLAMAEDSRREGDRTGSWDYAAIAQSFAQNAIKNGTGIDDRGDMKMPQDYDSCVAEFERLRTRYADLDPGKAIMVSPIIYAHVTSELSRAEHELNEPRQWERAARRMSVVEADIDTIWAQDVDDDGVADMNDGAPWSAEDKDDFEDEDGVPDPDNDKDGILDEDDAAPNDAETHNRWHDADGAPDEYPDLETIMFASGSAAFTSETRGYLRGIVHMLDEWPELKLHIKGHTDNTHSERYNQDLSKRRAEVIAAYLVSVGAPEDRLITSFYGETQAVNDNQSSADHAANRRVALEFE